MADPRTLPMGLHLPGLLTILSEHLYSDPSVALREALQNAHDSCERRGAEAHEEGYQPRVVVRLDAKGRRIELADNGSGLTEAEIAEFLAIIGRSYTGELRARLEVGGAAELAAAEHLIGQFGLGFLSAFLLARRVVLTTRSYRPGSKTLRFVSTGGQSYELEVLPEDQAREVGTTLCMELKPAAQFLLDAEVLERAITTYVDFLPTPVYLSVAGAVAEEDAPETPVNRGAAPWHAEATENDYVEFVRSRFEVEPLTVLPLSDVVIRLGDDRVTIPISGVLFVPPGSITSLQEYGDVAVYVRRMFICERERDLLPAWARFVRGVVESSRLRPTVSREALRQDETFRQVQAGLEAQLVRHFEELARTQPETWREIVLAHNDLIKGWALQAPRLFAAVADLIHFETSRGRLTLAEIRRATGDVLHYFSDDSGLNQERLLFESRGLLVIDASRFAEEAFLRRYADETTGVTLDQLRPGSSGLFEVAEGELPRVVAHFGARSVACRAVRFEPPSLPALLLYPPTHDRVRRVRDALEQGRLSGPIGELLRDFVERRAGGGDIGPVLHLNAASELLQGLERRGAADPAFSAALDLVFQTARFFAGKRLSADESRVAFESAMASLAALIRPRDGAGDGGGR
jgi:molecular chaperone HtpG